MNRSKLLRLATSFAATRRLGLNSSGLTQVTRFSTHSPPCINPRSSSCDKYINVHQRLWFSSSSSKTGTFVDVIAASNEWSKEIEMELGKMMPKLTHESVVYGLLKLKDNPRKSLDFYKWVALKKGFGPSNVAYGLLLWSLACKDFLKDFWTVAFEVQQKGLFVEGSMVNKIILKLESRKLYKAANDWKKLGKAMWDFYHENNFFGVICLITCQGWEEAKAELKKKLKFPLSQSFVLYALLDVGKCEPTRALQFFNWVADCGGYQHDSVTYNRMLVILADSNNLVDEFWDLVGRMKREGFDVDHFSLASICRGLPVSDAIMLYELMMEDGPYKPSLFDRDLRTENITRELNPNMDLAYRVMNKCVAAGITRSKTLYNGMHRTLCKIGKFDEAKKIVQEMRKAGFKPDNRTYNQEVYGLCAQKRLEQARVMLDQMGAEGCIPDTETWTILLQGYCAAGLVDEALSCFAEMVGKNVNPDAKTLDVLLHGFVSKNEMLGAHKFLIELISKHDIVPWGATYECMIWKLLEGEKLEEALDLLSMMNEQGYKPFPDPIFEHISKTGTLDDVKKYFKALTPEGAPSTALYVQFIKRFCVYGRPEQARVLLDHMEAEGCIPDTTTWMILLQEYCATDRVDEALLCFAEMVGKNMNPGSETLDGLLHKFISKNEILGAHKFLIEMVSKHDIIPLGATYEHMIRKLVKGKKLEEAIELLRMMKKQGHEPYFDPIFEHISKTGTLDDVKKVFKALTPKGAPSTAAYVHVIRCFMKQGRDSEARDLIKKSPSRVRSHELISQMIPEEDIAVV